MSIEVIFYLAAVIWCAICVFIAKNSLPKQSGFINSRQFLFSKISKNGLIASNAGSMISFYVIFIGGFLMSFGWGTLVGVFCILPIPIAYLFLNRLISKFIDLKSAKKRDDLTIPEYLISQEDHNSSFKMKLSKITGWFAALFMSIFALSTMGSEVAALKLLTSSITWSSSQGNFLDASGLNTLNLSYFFVGTCVIYIFFVGLRGVIATDMIQLIFILLFVLISTYLIFSHIALDEIWKILVNQLPHSSREWQVSIVIGFAIIFLSTSWIISTQDIWIRISLYLEDKASSTSPAEQKKAVLKVLNTSSLLGVLIISVPVLVGLILKDHVRNIECGQTTIEMLDTVQINNQIKAHSPLNIHLDNHNNDCSVSIINSKINEHHIESFTKFTNFPYWIINTVKQSHEEYGRSINIPTIAFFVLAIALIAIFSISMTTIDTLILLTAQLSKSIKLSLHPKTVIPFSAVLVILIDNYFGKPETYLSLGVFAWTNLVFLAYITLVFCYSATCSKHNYFLGGLLAYLIWFLLFVVPHFLYVSFGINDFLNTGINYALRTTMPYSAVLLLMFSAVVVKTYSKIKK